MELRFKLNNYYNQICRGEYFQEFEKKVFNSYVGQYFIKNDVCLMTHEYFPLKMWLLVLFKSNFLNGVNTIIFHSLILLCCLLDKTKTVNCG